MSIWSDIAGAWQSKKPLSPRFIKLLVLLTIIGSLIVASLIAVPQLLKNQEFSRRAAENKIFIPGKSKVSELLTAENLAFPPLPLPKPPDYHFFRSEKTWSREKLKSQWLDDKALSLSELSKKNRKQLENMLKNVP